MNDINTAIRQIIVQAANGKVSDFYALITAEYEPDMYSRDDDYVSARQRIKRKHETERFVHLYMN